MAISSINHAVSDRVAAIEDVGLKYSGLGPGLENVVARLAGQAIDALAADQVIVSGATVKLIAPAVANQCVVAPLAYLWSPAHRFRGRVSPAHLRAVDNTAFTPIVGSGPGNAANAPSRSGDTLVRDQGALHP